MQFLSSVSNPSRCMHIVCSCMFPSLSFGSLVLVASGIPTRLRSTSAIDLSAVRRAKAQASYATLANLSRGSGASLRKFFNYYYLSFFPQECFFFLNFKCACDFLAWFFFALGWIVFQVFSLITFCSIIFVISNFDFGNKLDEFVMLIL